MQRPNAMPDKANHTPIDWDALLRELDWQDDDDHQQRLLQERLKTRAQQYAQPKTTSDGAANEATGTDEALYTALTFTLDDETYALDVMAVRGVRAVTHITRVPGVPPFYRGVMNVRGQIYTVLDLRIFFHMAGNGVDMPQVAMPDEALLVTAENLSLALVAHRVNDVLRLSPDQIEPLDMPYTLGMTINRVIVLDIHALFADDRLIIGGDNAQ